MTFEDYKNAVLDNAPISDGLEYDIAVLWLHRQYLPVGVKKMNNHDEVVRIPHWYKNEYGTIVPVIAVGKNVLGSNPNMTDLILPSSIDRLTPFTLSNCAKLKRLTFPKAITTVPEKAFIDCAALEDIYYEGSSEEWENIDIVRYKDQSVVDYSKLGLFCKVATTRYPLPGNEAIFRARIHFDCAFDDGNRAIYGVYCGNRPLPLIRTI